MLQNVTLKCNRIKNQINYEKPVNFIKYKVLSIYCNIIIPIIQKHIMKGQVKYPTINKYEHFQNIICIKLLYRCLLFIK